MAVIYDFGAYHAPGLLRSFSQQAGDVVRHYGDFSKHMKKLSAGLCSMKEAQHAFRTQLDVYLLELEETRKFAHTCSEACELDSIEQMIHKRDQLIREKRGKTGN